METPLHVGNASASLEVTATVEKLEGTEPVRAINLSMEASGAAMDVRDESLQDVHAGNIQFLCTSSLCLSPRGATGKLRSSFSWEEQLWSSSS